MFEIAKLDETHRMIFGYANVAMKRDGALLTDLQGDQIAPDALEMGAYDFVLNSRSSGEMHEGGVVGQLVESVVFTPEKLEKMGLPKDAIPASWWVGFQLDHSTFAKVQSGAYRMFSIQGRVERSETV